MKSYLLKTELVFFSLLSISLSSLTIAESGLREEPYKENAHYKRVTAIHKDHIKAGKIEVIEFFLYSCPHCYELEPKLKAWLEKHKDEVNYKQVPAVVAPSWIPLAKAYYVAEKLNILDSTHEALFKAIHNDKRIFLNEYTLSKFFAQHGVKPNVFMHEFNAKDVMQKVSDARIMCAKYAFRGVPIVVINDEFKTAPFYNKDQEQMLKVMDYLLTKVNKEKPTKPSK
jgi:thiol:disulfide interchange protein DsbA